ncbi:sensor histidine kinase [Herbidospora mongoliensis]|uniref:sensor histidine kinase n=1 Tax=Herbidospora mongoliensis TaxID=688067 RepID=UPI000837A90B|nr:histidine kinase [Herbidospora mongoliensis]
MATDVAAAVCDWEDDLRRAGRAAPVELSVMFRVGAPALALAFTAGAVPAAALAPQPRIIGIVLVLVSAIPWGRWLVKGDDGPTWWFAVAVLGPLGAAALIGLDSPVASLMLLAVGLLLVALNVGFAPLPLVAGVTGATYLVTLVVLIGAPPVVLVAAHLGFALTLAAAYAVRVSHNSSRLVAQALEALALQRAADQRRIMAQDVHDVVGHTLAVTMLHITAARMAIKRERSADALEALEEAERHGRASLADLRRLVKVLRSGEESTTSPQPGLADVEALVESFRVAGSPVEFTLSVDGVAVVNPGAELAAYRIVQEALANAVRHGAGAARVALTVAGGDLSVEIGNPLGTLRDNGPGSGLAGMRERAAAAGGEFDAGIRDGQWLVSARIPA